MAGRSDRPAAGLVLHVTNIATPYRLPVYRAIRRRLLDDGGDLHVFFLGRGNRKREWKIPDEDMEGLVWTTATPDGSPAAEARAAIDRLRPDAVVLAWAMDPTALRLLLHCRRKGIPCLLLTGETPYTFSRRRFRRLLSIARLPFFRLADGFIAYGTKSRDYILAQGIDPGRVTIAINVVDTGFFCRSIESLHRSGESDLERARYRDRDGRPFACHLLFVGEMLSFKGLVQTLDAFALLAREDIALHIVGSGPMFDELKGIVAGKKLDEQVFFHGYHQKQELPFFYAFADILLFPL